MVKVVNVEAELRRRAEAGLYDELEMAFTARAALRVHLDAPSPRKNEHDELNRVVRRCSPVTTPSYHSESVLVRRRHGCAVAMAVFMAGSDRLLVELFCMGQLAPCTERRHHRHRRQ